MREKALELSQVLALADALGVSEECLEVFLASRRHRRDTLSRLKTLAGGPTVIPVRGVAGSPVRSF